MKITNVERYKRITKELGQIGNAIKLISINISNLESDIEKVFGLKYVDRDPGFDCWKITGLQGYYPTPEDAIKALEDYENQPEEPRGIVG